MEKVGQGDKSLNFSKRLLIEFLFETRLAYGCLRECAQSLPPMLLHESEKSRIVANGIEPRIEQIALD